MRVTKLIALVAIASFASTQASATTISLIGGAIADGNGDFFYDTNGQSPDAANENTARDRGLADIPTPGASLSTANWDITRVFYSGGSSAIGFDGLFGLAGDAGPGPGQSGQVFVNSGVINVSNVGSLGSGFLNDEFTLDYAVGSDGANGASAQAVLIFDEGLGTEATVAIGGNPSTVPGDLPTGTLVTGATALAPANYSTVSLSITLTTGNGGGNRGLLDDVRLSVTQVPEPNAVALSLLALAGFGAAGMRTRLG